MPPTQQSWTREWGRSRVTCSNAPQACGPGTANTISIVIPALNEERFIEKCIQAVRRLEKPQSDTELELIVVDNESTDRTVEICREQGVKVVSTPPGKPARARNLGAGSARGEFIAFLDADCEPGEDWLARCFSHFVDERTLAVGGRIAPPRSERSWVASAASDIASAKGARAEVVKWIPTAGMVVRRQAFDSLGGFDEQLTTCEDCDFGYRLSRVGHVLCDPAAVVIHHGESNTLSQVFKREAWRSRDNLRVSLARPMDWRNWLSLLIPVAYTAMLVLVVAGAPVLFVQDSLLPVWLSALALVVTTPPALLVLRRREFPGLVSLCKQASVLSTYMLGRTIGLFWSFPRVER